MIQPSIGFQTVEEFSQSFEHKTEDKFWGHKSMHGQGLIPLKFK